MFPDTENLFQFIFIFLQVPQLTINLLIHYLVDVGLMSSPLTESRIDNRMKPEDTGMYNLSMSPKGTEKNIF